MSPSNSMESNNNADVMQPEQRNDHNCNGLNVKQNFKNKKSFANRRDEVATIRSKYPTKIPIIVERFSKEKSLNPLDKTKFLVPQEVTMSQFVTIIRNRMHLSPQQALYLLVNNRNMASLSRTLAEVYQEHRDDDGFLYITYASQETFGAGA